MTGRQVVVIAGVGGQGVLTTARSLGEAAMAAGIPAVVGQQHGMSRRLGSVRATVVLGGGRTVLVGPAAATVLLGLDPLEAVRALDACAPDCVMVCASHGIPLDGAPPEPELVDFLRRRGAHIVDPPSSLHAGAALLSAWVATGTCPFAPGALDLELVP